MADETPMDVKEEVAEVSFSLHFHSLPQYVIRARSCRLIGSLSLDDRAS